MENFTVNDSELSFFAASYPGWNPEDIITVVIAATIIPFILMGNLAVVVAVAHYRRLQVPTNYLLVSLALADICIGLAIPFSITKEVFKPRLTNTVLCLVPHCVLMTFGGASLLCMAVIAFDRHTALSRAMDYSQVVTVKRIVLLAVGCWMYAMLVAWSPFYGLHDTIKLPHRPCSFHIIHNEALLLLFLALFLPPYLIIFHCYWRIWVVARHHAKAIQAQGMLAHLNSHMFLKNRKCAKTLGIVIGCFVILWMPYQITVLLDIFSVFEACDVLINFLGLLTYCNSAINPWIYAYHNAEFRRAFKLLLRPIITIKATKITHAQGNHDDVTCGTSQEDDNIDSGVYYPEAGTLSGLTPKVSISSANTRKISNLTRDGVLGKIEEEDSLRAVSLSFHQGDGPAWPIPLLEGQTDYGYSHIYTLPRAQPESAADRVSTGTSSDITTDTVTLTSLDTTTQRHCAQGRRDSLCRRDSIGRRDSLGRRNSLRRHSFSGRSESLLPAYPQTQCWTMQLPKGPSNYDVDSTAIYSRRNSSELQQLLPVQNILSESRISVFSRGCQGDSFESDTTCNIPSDYSSASISYGIKEDSSSHMSWDWNNIIFIGWLNAKIG